MARRVPGVSKWHAHAGGSAAAPDKHGYTLKACGVEYHISPSSTPTGRHRGYQLTAFPSFGHSTWTWIGADGAEHYVPGPIHRSPEAAARAADAHCVRYKSGATSGFGALAGFVRGV